MNHGVCGWSQFEVASLSFPESLKWKHVGSLNQINHKECERLVFVWRA